MVEEFEKLCIDHTLPQNQELAVTFVEQKNMPLSSKMWLILHSWILCRYRPISCMHSSSSSSIYTGTLHLCNGTLDVYTYIHICTWSYLCFLYRVCIYTQSCSCYKQLLISVAARTALQQELYTRTIHNTHVHIQAHFIPCQH